jgi:hypothetical protein
MAQLKYLPAGIRLHLQEFYLKLTGRLGKGFYFHFPSIPAGLKAEKVARRAGLPVLSIPIPDQIFPDCGVGLVVGEKEGLKRVLEEAGIEFEIYYFDGKRYQWVEGKFSSTTSEGCQL